MEKYLLDNDFLDKLNHYPHKDIFAKVISLTFDEEPIESIEGKITGGSINGDGKSAVRRTCNLSMVAKNVNINNYHWGINQKFSLEIGVKNYIEPKYPEIIWFKQGIYVFTSFNSSLANNNYSISLSGKDKMCLLNGDIGGSLPASIDFGRIDTYDDSYSRVEFEDKSQYQANRYYTYANGKYTISKEKYNSEEKYYVKDVLVQSDKIIIKNIIREAVHVYGREPYHNIIVNDLDDYGLELLEYRGDQPLYFLFDEEASIYDQMIFESTAKNIEVEEAGTGNKFTLDKCPVLNSAVDELNDNRTKFYLEIGTETGTDKRLYSLSKVEYGQTAGYRVTDLVYNGELISSIGEALTSILDKIKNMLGPFEYFYDINGRFVFQAKKIYTKNSWNPIVHTDDDYFVRDAVEESPYIYSFEDLNLIQRFQNAPAINNLKNDYSIWGTRKTVSGAEIPIHARYAIQEKPVYYKSFKDIIYCTEEFYGELNGEEKIVDWREIIYQMAKDYYKNNQNEDFLYNLIQNNYIVDATGEKVALYPTGLTGYEMFYEDIQGFWRQLYDPEPELNYESSGGKYEEIHLYKVLNLTEESYLKNPNDYFVLISGEWTPAPGWIKDAEYYTDKAELTDQETYKVGTIWNPFEETQNYTCDYYLKGPNDENHSTSYYYWNKAVEKAPETLNFWIDFYEGADLMQYNISAIGARQKVVNDSKITSVYFRNVPKVIFIDANKENYDVAKMSAGYQYAQLSKGMENLFSISAQGKSAEEEMEELINNYSYCSEGLSITTIPVYNLEPNTLIHLYNEETNINGKYQIDKITIPLTYNGVMNITATKIIDQIY